MEKERRRSPRAPILIEVSYEGAGVRGETRISDISAAGVFVDTLNPLPTGVTLTLSFTLPDGRLIEATGVVVHSQPRIGMGVTFTSISADDSQHIREFIGCEEPKPL